MADGTKWRTEGLLAQGLGAHDVVAAVPIYHVHHNIENNQENPCMQNYWSCRQMILMCDINTQNTHLMTRRDPVSMTVFLIRVSGYILRVMYVGWNFNFGNTALDWIQALLE
jgi:hypothetical protein